jgi:hydroxylamine reductase
LRPRNDQQIRGAHTDGLSALATDTMATAEPVHVNDTIAVVLMKRPSAAHVFVGRRMHCLGCDVAAFETLAEACAVYGLPVDDILAELDRPPDADRQENNR